MRQTDNKRQRETRIQTDRQRDTLTQKQTERQKAGALMGRRDINVEFL